MRQLNPNNPADRRITSFTRYWYISTFPNGDMLLGHLSFDCWGKRQHGVKKLRMSAAGAKLHIGQHTNLSLRLMQRGCCPPQLAGEMEGDMSATDSRGDAAQEAMMLHKRGYLGGGG